MRPEESFLGAPVRSLQTMLRVIAEARDDQLTVIPDGFYGTDTARAISNFQRNAGLPMTGVTNEETWNAVVAEYELALVQINQAQPIDVVFEPKQVIRRNEYHPNLYLAQSILVVLSKAFPGIPSPEITGNLDIPTADALRVFQAMNQIPVTGDLDRQTWRHLALQYPLAAEITMRE